MVRKLWLAFSVLLVLCAAALAEERFGIQVYPGASYDAANSKKKQESMAIDGLEVAKIADFTTNDSVAKVVTFYKTQPGLKLMGNATNEGAMFRKDKTDVTIQNPWMDMTTGKMMANTLISIVQQKK